MGLYTNAFHTYDAIGNREDLIDVIENISPVEAWFTSNTGSGKALQRYHEWQTDALASAAANAKLEGQIYTASAITPTTRTGNYCQILSKDVAVSDTQEATSSAGRASELAYQKAKALKELANDIEYALIVNLSAAYASTGAARQLKGVYGWVTTNITCATANGTAALTETLLNDNLALIWGQGGKPQNVIVGAFQKRKISAWTQPNTRMIQADTKAVVAGVDVYDSDFGRLFIRLHYIMNSTAGTSPHLMCASAIIFGEPRLWKKAWLRPIKAEQLARTAAATHIHVEAELTLESLQEKGSGIIKQLQYA